MITLVFYIWQTISVSVQLIAGMLHDSQNLMLANIASNITTYGLKDMIVVDGLCLARNGGAGVLTVLTRLRLVGSPGCKKEDRHTVSFLVFVILPSSVGLTQRNVADTKYCVAKM